MDTMTSQQQDTNSVETRANEPREVAEMIAAVRAFTDTVERVVAGELHEAAGQLGKLELAWVIDRLDDVRGCVATVLGELAASAEQYGADVDSVPDALRALSDAGVCMYGVMHELDPDCDRWDLSGQR